MLSRGNLTKPVFVAGIILLFSIIMHLRFSFQHSESLSSLLQKISDEKLLAADKLSKLREQLSSRKIAYSKQISAFHSSVQNMTEELNELQEETDSLKDEFSRREEKYQKLQALIHNETSQYQKNINHAKKKNNQLEQQISTKESQLEALQKELGERLEEYSKFQEKNKTDSQDRILLQEQVSKSNADIEKAQLELEKCLPKNQSVEFARSDVNDVTDQTIKEQEGDTGDTHQSYLQNADDAPGEDDLEPDFTLHSVISPHPQPKNVHSKKL